MQAGTERECITHDYDKMNTLNKREYCQHSRDSPPCLLLIKKSTKMVFVKAQIMVTSGGVEMVMIKRKHYCF